MVAGPDGAADEELLSAGGGVHLGAEGGDEDGVVGGIEGLVVDVDAVEDDVAEGPHALRLAAEEKIPHRVRERAGFGVARETGVRLAARAAEGEEDLLACVLAFPDICRYVLGFPEVCGTSCLLSGSLRVGVCPGAEVQSRISSGCLEFVKEGKIDNVVRAVGAEITKGNGAVLAPPCY